MSQRAKKKKVKFKKVSYKDKLWYSVVAPKIFNYREVGEIIGLEGNIIGRTIESLYYDFTRNWNDINLKLKFKITGVNEEAKKCSSVLYGHEYTNDFVRSLIGRGSTKIATILNLETKDKFIYRVTVVCITLKRAKNSQKIIIRKIMREILKEFAKSLNHEKFVKGMIGREFQSQIRRVAKTIYPLSNCILTKSKLISIPHGGEDMEIPDDQFEIVEVQVNRSRKSDIKRSERINVRMFTDKKNKRTTRQPISPSKPEESKDSSKKE